MNILCSSGWIRWSKVEYIDAINFSLAVARESCHVLARKPRSNVSLLWQHTSLIFSGLVRLVRDLQQLIYLQLTF